MTRTERIFAGLPQEDLFIFDSHAHVGSQIDLQLLDNTPADIVRTLDRVGVKAICASSIRSLCADPVSGNAISREAGEAFPGRIYAYATPNPFHPEYDVADCFGEGSVFRGVKIHGLFQNNTAINDPRYFPAYETASRLGVPVLVHTWGENEVNQVADVAAKFRGAPFLIGHSGMTSFQAKQAVIAAVKSLDNVFVDTTISYTYDGALEYIVSGVGADRVLYGSDVAFYDCTHTIGKILLSKLTDGEKEQILGLNARKLFRNIG